MRLQKHPAGMLCLFLVVATSLTGCSKSQEVTTTTAAPAATTPTEAGKKPAAGAGTPDMNDYPAPAGVQTGVLPGGRK